MTFLLWIVCAALGGASLSATGAETPTKLDQAVRAWAEAPEGIAFRYSLLDLNGDGTVDAVVMIADRQWCGSGGCSLLVLAGRTDGSFQVISSATVTREPIARLSERSHGWNTLVVSVGGGGKKPCQVLMRFDGKRYPGNPTVLRCAGANELVTAEAITLK